MPRWPRSQPGSKGCVMSRFRAADAVNARWTRVEDTIAFAKLMEYRKTGIATCIGLLEETDRLAAILKAQGFEPMSVCCKAGSIDKLKLGLSETDKINKLSFAGIVRDLPEQGVSPYQCV